MRSFHSIALISQTTKAPYDRVVAVAAALQAQVSRQLFPVWQVSAGVLPLQDIKKLPAGCVPLVIQDKVKSPGLYGYHRLTDNGTPNDPADDWPFAVIEYTENWTLDTSHELMEILVDPEGRRLIAGAAPASSTQGGMVDYLAEICDPCGRAEAAYTLMGEVVSDFVTPDYYSGGAGRIYSQTGWVTQPQALRKGGYFSWKPSGADGPWTMTQRNNNGAFSEQAIAAPNIYGSYREYIDAASVAFLAKSGMNKSSRLKLEKIRNEAKAERKGLAMGTRRRAGQYARWMKRNFK